LFYLKSNDMNTTIKTGTNWLQTLRLFMRSGGVILVIGGVDTGKSTFCRWLVTETAAEKIPTALVDADVGQSDIGPPACIGMAYYDKLPVECSPAKTDGLYFIGSTSPSYYQAQCIAGIVRLTEKARKMGASHIIVNTTGWISGTGAVNYKQAKIDALQPRIIAALQHSNELEPIVKPYEKMLSIKTIKIAVSDAVIPRDRERRALVRKNRFDEYFRRSKLQTISINQASLSDLNLPIPRKEILNKIIGLNNGHNECISLGIVEDYQEKERVFRIRSPFKGSLDSIKMLQFQGDIFYNPI
jgi:polynucleotide 5'-hydroxyl-kinase GRC3/NOL9